MQGIGAECRLHCILPMLCDTLAMAKSPAVYEVIKSRASGGPRTLE